jgi:amino acid adenylation domain-containing protein
MISRDNLRDLYPLTPMQEGMLFHALLDGGSRAYHEQVAYDLTGPLDPVLFERAWQMLVDRHDVLRTVFVHEKAERPLQAVMNTAAVAFGFRDLSGTPAARRQDAVDAYLAEDRARGFDLRREVALRVAVLRFEDRRHVVVWSFHHILLDGWSTGIVVSELATLYNALRGGDTPSLQAPVPFSRYLTWFGERDAHAAKDYWNSMLAGYEGRMAIPGHAARHGDGYEQSELNVDLDVSYSNLKAVAAHLQVTPYTLLQTAWAVLMGRANQTGDVVFGSIVSGRPPAVPDIERMVGLLINALPVRVKFDERDSLASIATRIHQASFDANDHSFLPLSETSGATLVTHLLAFETYPLDIAQAPDPGEDALRLESVRSHESTHYDLSLVISPTERLRLTFLFNRRAFEDGAIAALASNLQTILQAFVEDPNRTVAATPIPASAEWQWQLAWADASSPYPSDRTIPELFDDFEPDAIAIVDGDRNVTYAELDRRSNQLAHQLRERGIGPDRIVGVANVRSAEMVVAALAVVKAGGAYLGIEPEWPEDRVRFILEDAGAETVLTKAPASRELKASGREILELNLGDAWAGPETRLDVAINPRNLAYICYTSGSTGRPKGVAVEHRSVMRLVRDTNYVEFRKDAAVLLFCPLAFDVSTFELWGTLLNKGRLVVVTEQLPSLEELATVLLAYNVDTAWLTSGLFAAMVDERLDAFVGVRQLLTGGDVVSPPHARKVLDAHPTLTLINGYGPTESTTYTTCHSMATPADVENPVSIGTAIRNTRLYVLDAARRPLPIGAAGELFIAGDGLARDYRNRRSLTADRFIPDPFALVPGERMYTSGDIVRLRRNGTLEFLGRRDSQLKIRGFRVEPGELEAVLNAVPDVKACVVVPRRNDAGEASLVAYVVPEDPRRFDAVALRSLIETQVPEFLVPSAIIVLSGLPLTPNGKLDRRRLPEPGAAGPAAAADPGREFIEPSTETERHIATIWCEVLNVERVSATDDFFELGGHSLNALRVVSRLRKALGMEVPLPLMFAQPTIAGLAAELDARAAAGAPAHKPLARRARVPIALDAPSAE